MAPLLPQRLASQSKGIENRIESEEMHPVTLKASNAKDPTGVVGDDGRR